jgi:hypothetical protein
MLAPDEVAAMVQLPKLGWGTKRIADELGCSRNTVKRYLAAVGWAALRPPQRKRRLVGSASGWRGVSGSTAATATWCAGIWCANIGSRCRCGRWSAPALVAAFAKAHADGRVEERLGFFAKPKLLIIDELGCLPFETNAEHLFFQLVSARYERGSVLITSNRAVGEWGSVFGDPVVATAILDRLLHHSQVITIRGDSYRLREKRRSALVKATLTPRRWREPLDFRHVTQYNPPPLPKRRAAQAASRRASMG